MGKDDQQTIATEGLYYQAKHDIPQPREAAYDDMEMLRYIIKKAIGVKQFHHHFNGKVGAYIFYELHDDGSAAFYNLWGDPIALLNLSGKDTPEPNR